MPILHIKGILKEANCKYREHKRNQMKPYLEVEDFVPGAMIIHSVLLDSSTCTTYKGTSSKMCCIGNVLSQNSRIKVYVCK